jgi:serine phosphatase RsbU (regulator of sigma subunit)
MIETSIPESEIKAEFNRSTEKAHVIACWIGVALNLLWFASDYFVLPDHWIQFLLFRVSVSTISFLLLVLKNKLKLSIYFCVFVLVLGISVQNAYMWSVMDVEHLQQHAFAYIALFIGVGMLVLWEVRLSVILLIVTIVSNIFFYVLNSPLTVDEFLTHGGFLTFTVAIFCVFLIRTRYRLTYKEIKSRMELAKSKQMIEAEHTVVLEQKKEILDSINYAKRIQLAVLPNEETIQRNIPLYFIYYRPKAIVSGDFYWFHAIDMDSYIYVNADCTGHGVPGAFMTVIASNLLNQTVIDNKIYQPSLILQEVDRLLSMTLKQDSERFHNVQDGMDLTLVKVNKAKREVVITSAKRPVVYIRNKQFLEIKANKFSIGGMRTETKVFEEVKIECQQDDMMYLFTDGYHDQFGGPKGKKYSSKKLKEKFMEIHMKGISEQKAELDAAMRSWKGDLEQIDDICVTGIRF